MHRRLCSPIVWWGRSLCPNVCGTVRASEVWTLNSATTHTDMQMTPSTIDLLFITFNCAKSIIDTSVFSNHLQDVLRQNPTALPELVVLFVFTSSLFV